MTTEIQENFKNHSHHQQQSGGGGTIDQAIDEGGGGGRARGGECTNNPPLITLKPSTPNDAGAHECSSSNNSKMNSSNNIKNTNNNITTTINTPTTKTKAINVLASNNKCQLSSTSDEDGFLSTSPDSANEELLHSKTIGSSNSSSSCGGNSGGGGGGGGFGGVGATNTDSSSGDNALTELATTSSSNPPPSVCFCSTPKDCVTVRNILESFKAALSEEQAWALLYQIMSFYRRVSATGKRHIFQDLDIPESIDNISLHRDGSVHCTWSETERKKKEQAKLKELEAQQEDEQSGDDHHVQHIMSHKKVLRKIAVIVYNALDYNLHEDEQCQMSQELEELITHMTEDESDDDCIDEGIDEGYKRWDDEHDETKEFDYVLEACKNHIKPTVPEDHYRAVCRALVTETLELRIFLQQVLNTGADNLHLKLKADSSQTSHQELAKLGFNDWKELEMWRTVQARFWVQVIDELRRGVRLKKANYERAPTEFELTPYEILMEDIRSRKYQLRKVMVNGDIPPRVKKDAHALILDFIRSRPPLKKASERQLPPPVKRTPSPREQLMDSIRQGRTLKHIPSPTLPRLRDRLLPSLTNTATAASHITATAATVAHQQHHYHHQQQQQQLQHQQQQQHKLKIQDNVLDSHTTPRSKQRLIKVDYSLLQDDDTCFDEPLQVSSASSASTVGHGGGSHNHNVNFGVCSQPKMPPYPIGGYMVSGVGDTSATNNPSATVAGKTASNPVKSTNNNTTNMNQMPTTLATRVTRRTTYDLATQCESRRASQRRHTIVGCQSNFDEVQSMPTSRPASRQSEEIGSRNDNVSTAQQLHNNDDNKERVGHQNSHQQPLMKRPQPNALNEVEDSSIESHSSSSSIGPWNKSFMDEKTWTERGDDRLSLTLEEIVHIRSVMTKAELEGLPVGIRVKEDVEKRKICFLCLRTRFSIFGPWGIQCKICQRTVCSKCYTKMRIPSEHCRNVPLVLISPSLLASPAGSSTPSPSHHARYVHSSSTGNIMDETFPKSLIERLMGSEAQRKARNSVGSAPSSPKHQRSNMSTPGIMAGGVVDVPAAGQAVEALHDTTTSNAMTTSYPHYSHQQQSYHPQHHYASMALANGVQMQYNHSGCKENHATNNRQFSIMSRSMEGPRSLPVHSPASRPHSNSSTLDRKSKFSRAYTLSSSGTQLSQDQKDTLRGDLVPVCNDCRGLVMEISRSAKQKRSSARNRTLKNLTLDLSPVWK